MNARVGRSLAFALPVLLAACGSCEGETPEWRGEPTPEVASPIEPPEPAETPAPEPAPTPAATANELVEWVRSRPEIVSPEGAYLYRFYTASETWICYSPRTAFREVPPIPGREAFCWIEPAGTRHLSAYTPDYSTFQDVRVADGTHSFYLTLTRNGDRVVREYRFPSSEGRTVARLVGPARPSSRTRPVDEPWEPLTMLADAPPDSAWENAPFDFNPFASEGELGGVVVTLRTRPWPQLYQIGVRAGGVWHFTDVLETDAEESWVGVEDGFDTTGARRTLVLEWERHRGYDAECITQRGKSWFAIAGGGLEPRGEITLFRSGYEWRLDPSTGRMDYVWIPGTTVALMAEVQLELEAVSLGCAATRTRRARQMIWPDDELPIRYGPLPRGYTPVLEPATYEYTATGWSVGVCPSVAP